ncbi:MAG TPA: trypsin-like peptidase domain-containing protein [Bryobacteraceae bacterium]|nr:trypsin-like peptidase domain-containing protein [Bryobacteraceae bacterium]
MRVPNLIVPLILVSAPAFPQIRGTASLGDLSASLESLVARVRPSVVQIFSTTYAAAEEGEGTSAASLLSKQLSTGSGVILSEDGLILTNNHVVHNAMKIEVKLHNPSRGRMAEAALPAKVIGVDREADLAVIKIDKAGLPKLILGDSSKLRQGQLVLALGNPLGLEGSVSMGIVSSTARQLKQDDPMTYVQTDAPINPGNSGGPLVDSEGHVVGINTFILSQSGGSEGIGFAVPSNVARSSFDQIMKDGHVHRGQIGIVAQTITPSLAKGLSLPQDFGVIAADVTPDGPAAKAGMKPGDILVTLGGKEMDSARELNTLLYQEPLSAVVDVTVKRDSKMLSFSIPVIDREDDPQRFADMVNPEKNLIRRLGILAIEITEELFDMLPELRHEYGIVVAARASDSPGSVLEPGDVIYELNKTPVVSIAAMRSVLDQMKPGAPAVLQIQRGSKLRYVVIDLE